MTRRPPIRAVVFDAGHTLLELDYARLTAYLVSRGHDLTVASVTDAERRAVAEWRRGFNVPIGLCHQADGEAAKALQRARDMGLVVGVISNSNGSVQRALDEAALGAYLEFVIDSSVVGAAKPDPRIFDPGRAWGERDCAVATGLCEAVEQAGLRGV